ncbi:MAG: putative membrane protein [Candidatus Omnitrophota bacterium]
MLIISRLIIACLFIGAGITHFLRPEVFAQIVPPFLPEPIILVYVSGFFEIIGGLGVLIPQLRVVAGRGLMLLLILVWPANVYMAFVHIPFEGWMGNPIIQWLRVPFQFVLIWWVHKASHSNS